MKEPRGGAYRTVQEVQFSPIAEKKPNISDKKQLDLLTDVSLHVSFELGRTRKNVRDILQLQQGSVLRLDKLAGEHVDVLVNQTVIAEGEVVLMDDKFAIRITGILPHQERERKIR